MDRSNVRKRATMRLDSDDEEEDMLTDLPQPKTKKRREDAVENLATGPPDFIQALTESGFQPRSGNLPNILSVQQTDFQQSLREYLTNSVHFPRNMDFFVSECDTFFNERENFIKALHPTENASDEAKNTMTLPQDSLVRILLNIDEIQPKLMAAILKRFAKAAKEEKPSVTEVNLPSLILSQLAWLNRIVDPALVVDTLLDLLSTSSSAIKKEIISHLPGMVVDREQIRVAFALCELLNENNNSLTAAILDALGDLSLPTMEAAELRAKVVKQLLTVPLEAVPVLLTFVFKRVQPEEASALIQEIRLNFDRALKKRNDRVTKDTLNDCISLSVESLQNSMIRSKTLADTWFKEIQIKTDSREHFCVDLLVLIIQHKFTGRRRVVELLLRKKMKSESLSMDLVKETFQHYNCVLKNYFEQLSAIADSLILTSDPMVIAHGSVVFQEMFIHFDEFYQQEVVQALIQHVCCGGDRASSPDSPATAALTVLQELAESNWDQLVRFSAYLVNLLEYIEYMALPQVKRVMELLAKMAYGFAMNDEAKKALASFSASIQSELLMIIKKQLSHTRVEFQRMGILGSVALVHVLANPDLVGELSDDGQLSQGAASLTVNDAGRSGILTGDERVSQAKTIIDIVNTSTKRVPEVAALFMDEMASTSLMHDIHPSLHSHLYDAVSETFQENFIVDEDEQPIDKFLMPLSLQYGLDVVDENATIKLVFLNIAPLIINEHSRKAGEKTNKPTVTTLMSHFRLLRHTIDSFDQANLEDIDALLGCAICLPSEEVTEDFENMVQSEKDIVCRCYFYAVNWFIEVINTFARSKPMRAKVIQRVRDFVELKDKFYRYLAKNTSFLPPPSVFFGEPIRTRVAQPAALKGKKGTTKKSVKGDKKGKDKGEVNNTTLGTPNKSVIHSTPVNSIQPSKLDFTASQPGKTVTNEVVHSTYAIHFRELDLSAFVLLSSPLELSESDASPVALKPKDLEFLLSDLAVKLDHKLLPSATKRRFPLQAQGAADKESFVMLDLYAPMEVAKRIVSLIRRMAMHLEAISGYFQQLIEMSDGMLDGPEMFNELAQRLGSCYTSIFRIFNRILSWHELQKTSAAPLLEDTLRHIASRIREDAKTASLTELHGSSFDYIEKFSKSVNFFSCAVEHVNLLCTLYNHGPDPDYSERLAGVAESFLKRSWSTAEGESEKGQKFNQGIESLLQVYLLHGPNTIEKLEDIVTVALPEVLDSEGAEGNSESLAFKTCNKATFTFYFRASFVALVEVVKKIPNTSSTPKSVKGTLKTWEKVVHLLNQLVVTVRTTDKRSILTTCLKQGRTVVELFYKSAMPLLDKQFKNFPTESQELLKSLQTTTRTLQNVCNHAKTSRDTSLAVHIPPVKKIQELLLYRVKAMLAANGCASAFWMGNLKNKNLKGQEIISQSTVDDSDNELLAKSSSEDEDDDDDVTVVKDNIVPEEDSDSRSREY